MPLERIGRVGLYQTESGKVSYLKVYEGESKSLAAIQGVRGHRVFIAYCDAKPPHVSNHSFGTFSDALKEYLPDVTDEEMSLAEKADGYTVKRSDESLSFAFSADDAIVSDALDKFLSSVDDPQ